jgi:exopolysaccharide biosynthesis protein
MKKILLFLAFNFCFGGLNIFAQNISDSLTILKTDWKITDIGNGISWKSYHFEQKNLFGSNQSINILETKLKSGKIKFALASADSLTKQDKSRGILKPTSQIASQNNALVAVNAGFFDTKNGGAVDFIKINGFVVDTTRQSAKQRLPFHAIAALTIHKNRIKIIKGEEKIGWENDILAENVLLTGPLLILNNEAQILPKTPFNDNRHPRTCACITNKKRLLLMTIDGRTAEAQGMTLLELTLLAKTLGCTDAINFDGGGSSTLWIANQPENGVVNYPCDNKIFDHKGERSVSNIFMILKKN